MNIIEPKILKGFRDFLPDQEQTRLRILYTLETVVREYGFVPIDTPVLEYTEVLLGKGGGETDKQIFHFKDNGGRDVAMRFDLTVPFARYMAAHRSELYLPFKRFHFAKVWRGETPQRGRYREFMQCDFDIVGIDSASADFEILLMMNRAFAALGIGKVRFHISHRGIFNRFLDRLGIGNKSVEILRAVDKIKKIGTEETMNLLTGFCGETAAAEIVSYITAAGETPLANRQTLLHIETLSGGASDESARMRSILDMADTLGIADKFFLDPSITRGLDYYTGIVYETFLTDLPTLGSVCSGGRYNDLANLYTNEKLPGVGSSIGLDRLLAGIEELGILGERQGGADIVVFCLDEALTAHYHEVAETCRKAGLRTEVYPQGKKLAAQFQYAEKKGIRFGLMIGSSEIEKGAVNLKNLMTRESYEGIDLHTALNKIKA